MAQSTKFLRCALPTDAASADVIRHFQEQGLLCADHALRRKDHILTVLSEAEVSLLKGAGIAVDVRAALANDKPPTEAPVENLTIGFVSGYLDTPGIHAAFAALHAAFPALSQLTDLPESTSGYDGAQPGLAGPAAVKLFRITTTPAVFSKPALLIVAGLHAREWAPPLAAIEFASQLLNNYAPGSVDPDVVALNQLVEGLDILFIGAGNPDGINYSRHDEALWRKNRRSNPPFPSCRGADLNRNFGIYWGQGGSSNDPCDYQTYHGPTAFSEAENRNIRHVVETFPNILAAIDCHSFGEDIFRPQPTGGSFIAAEPVSADDHAIYLALEATMNAAVGAVTPGKTYSTGTTSNHAGTFDEYMFFGHRIFGFELEIGQDFQPPIADALVSAQEAAAAMRALAKETLSLSTRFLTPVTMVQVIDKSGSMVSSGYVDATRANAKRMIDLMGLNDSTAVVSFNQAAAVALPLTTITSAGDYATARSAVSGIVFGGATSIGAGIQTALGVLPASGPRRSILLLSDGYENSPPMVSGILPSVPAGVPVHTIALGAASDQALLQSIAATTGGSYFFTPDELGLFQIYNIAHSAMADTDMVFEDTVSGSGTDDGSSGFRREIVVDPDADFLDISLAVQQGGAQLEAALASISFPNADLGRLVRKSGPGYLVLHLKRPQPGIYELRVTVRSRVAAACSVAAYVRSPVRLRFAGFDKRLVLGQPIDLAVSVLERGKAVPRLSLAANATAPMSSMRLLARQWKDSMGLKAPEGPDRLPQEVARALAVRENLHRSSGQDPFRYRTSRVHLVHPGQTDHKGATAVIRTPTAKAIDGTYGVRVDVKGRTSRGEPFVRVGYRSVLVGP